MDDPDHNRRNLVITSLAFIIYYWAEGTFGGSVTFGLVSLTFKNRDVLAGFAWAALLWFLYRFFIANPWPKFWWSYLNGYHDLVDSRKYVRWYFEHIGHFKLVKKGECAGYVWKGFDYDSNGNYSLSIHHYENIEWDDNAITNLKEIQSTKEITADFIGPLGMIVKGITYLDHSIVNEGFAKYLMPYFLFIFAILSWA